ncbi:MAG TPA: hypothetical protein VJI75_03840 [Candidatus Nanoarchaeia archaeon]|nr:hypothetical protein [Candidatus Nanoarchaeia archaeon]
MADHCHNVNLILGAIKENFGQARVGDVARILHDGLMTELDIGNRFTSLRNEGVLVRDSISGLYLIRDDPTPREAYYLRKIDSNYERIGELLERISKSDIDRIRRDNSAVGMHVENLIADYGTSRLMGKVIDLDNDLRRRDIPANLKVPYEDLDDIANNVVFAIKAHLNRAPKQRIYGYLGEHRSSVKRCVIDLRLKVLSGKAFLSKEGNTKMKSYSIMRYGSSDECLLLIARGLLYEQEDIVEALSANKVPKIGKLRKENSGLIAGVEDVLDRL